MIVKVLSSNVIFAFSQNNVPSLKVPAGSEVEIATQDCFANQLQTEQDRLESLDWERVNPATGPIYIEGARPGDILKVTINEIILNNQGVIATGKDLGILGERLEGLSSKIIPIVAGKAIFNSKIQIPLNPMIGVIGVAPPIGEVNCGTPGFHGGNMDNTMISTGAIIYFPVFVEGALFALGDLHAVMGDGEIGVSGVEVAGTVRVKLDLIKELKITNPILENNDYLSTIASAATLDEAIKEATINMAEILTKALPLPLAEITMLMSAVGQAQICQIVDPLKTARYLIPKWVLDQYNFNINLIK